MSIASEISRLQTAKAGLKTAIEGKGVTVPSATTLDGYPALVSSIPSGGGGDDWTRPSEWPNLDSINFTNFDGYYLTYDLGQTCELKAIRLCVTTTDNGAYIVERGTLSSGIFNVAESFEVNNNGMFYQNLDENNGNIQLWRVRAKTGYIKGGIFNKGMDGDVPPGGYQPCVEKYQKTEYLNQGNFNSPDVAISGSGRMINTTFYLQHDRWIGTCQDQSGLGSAWRYGFNLRLVDFSSASFPKITGFSQSFTGCTNRVKFDSRGANFSAVTNLQLAFNSSSLRWIDASSFSSAGGALNRIFENAYSLEVFFPMPHITYELNINDKQMINHDSLVRIINALDPTETAKTLSLGTTNRFKLSSEEIAVATSKGWTVG